jgi:undecaprenyl pyrophosphate phosphatase UppP
VTVLEAILLGVIQVIFMFFPVSSTSHLVLTQHWLIQQGPSLPSPDTPEMILFDLVVHVDNTSAAMMPSVFCNFARIRWGDIGRIQRQQQFMRALTEQALTPATLLRLPKILSVIQSHVDTNLGSEEMLALAKFARDIKQLLVTRSQPD